MCSMASEASRAAMTRDRRMISGRVPTTVRTLSFFILDFSYTVLHSVFHGVTQCYTL